MKPDSSPQETAAAVLAVLAGTPLQHAATRALMNPADLASAVAAYKAAGYAALERQGGPGGWFQAHIQFADRQAAEHAATTYLGPDLRHAETTTIVSRWWFIRKAPHWRLRCQPGHTVTLANTRAHISRILGAMLSQHLIEGWRETIYEPEIYVFGGKQGMDIAHRLFHADSRGVLNYLAHGQAGPSPAVGRREISILLCSTLMRGAGQDWHEQADIWNRVRETRPLPPATPLSRLREMRLSLQRLMTTDTNALASDNGPLAFAFDWAAAFTNAGKALAAEARDGTLTRGLRAILAHHIIFHWNRLGLNTTTQAILARAATEAGLDKPLHDDTRRAPTRDPDDGDMPADGCPGQRASRWPAAQDR